MITKGKVCGGILVDTIEKYSKFILGVLHETDCNFNMLCLAVCSCADLDHDEQFITYGLNLLLKEKLIVLNDGMYSLSTKGGLTTHSLLK